MFEYTWINIFINTIFLLLILEPIVHTQRVTLFTKLEITKLIAINSYYQLNNNILSTVNSQT